jgi:hypothetical protein
MPTDQVRIRSLYAGLNRTIIWFGLLVAAAWLFAIFSYYLSSKAGTDWFARSGSVMCLVGAAVTFRLAHFYQRALADDGIRSNTLHPGAIATGLQKYTGGLKTPPDWRKTPEQGASTSVLLAASPLLEGISGLYFEDCNEAQQLTKRPGDFTGGYAGYALGRTPNGCGIYP